MTLELNNKEDVDPLLLSTINVENTIRVVQNDIEKKLRPILVKLNDEGEPRLTNVQDKSIIFKLNILN